MLQLHLAFVGEVNATAQWCLPPPLTGHESQKAESHENLQIHPVNIYQRRSRLLFDFRFIAHHSGQIRSQTATRRDGMKYPLTHL